jgi:hypothetical protein
MNRRKENGQNQKGVSSQKNQRIDQSTSDLTPILPQKGEQTIANAGAQLKMPPQSDLLRLQRMSTVEAQELVLAIKCTIAGRRSSAGQFISEFLEPLALEEN